VRQNEVIVKSSFMRLSSRRRFILLATTVFNTRVSLGGPQEPVFSSSVQVVNILANVRAKSGEIVGTLGKDDFSILENGRPQTIGYFSRASDLPLTLGLMVDTSLSQLGVLNAERGASLRFLDQVLRENKDQVFIMQFDFSVQTRQPLTSSRARLGEALAFVDSPSRRELQTRSGGGTLLYDAVVQASEDVMQKQHGRKALIFLTDGVDNGSDATLATAIDAAHRADTLIYAILFSEGGFGGRDGKGVLTRLAKETGGAYFEVSKKLGIDQIFGIIQEDLRTQYSIGYVSDRPATVQEFRRIQLTTKRPNLLVQARDRYWTGATTRDQSTPQ
jgi:VWFA-related protein